MPRRKTRLALSKVVAMLDGGPSTPDDLRAAGWSVAVHNDYKQNGQTYTFWLVTHPDGRYLKGEGTTDAEALGQIRARLK